MHLFLNVCWRIGQCSALHTLCSLNGAVLVFLVRPSHWTKDKWCWAVNEKNNKKKTTLMVSLTVCFEWYFTPRIELIACLSFYKCETSNYASGHRLYYFSTFAGWKMGWILKSVEEDGGREGGKRKTCLDRWVLSALCLGLTVDYMVCGIPIWWL